MSQDALAEKLGLKSGKQAVSRWERGIAEPSLTQVIQIAEILETTVASLIGEETGAGSVASVPVNKMLVDKDDYIKILEENTALKRSEIERLRTIIPPTSTSTFSLNYVH